jgi:hypothetical protein
MLTTGNNNQAVMSGTAIAPIQYVTTNATGVALTGGSFPSGVSGVWNLNTYTISGTPTSAGIFNYTVSTTNSNGCPNAAASGAITVNTETAMPPDVNSTNTWTFGSQTWSDRVVATPSNCTQTDDLTSSDYSVAQYKIYEGRYYYTWTCAYNNRESFCPSPWSLPSKADFEVLKNNTTAPMLTYYWGEGYNMSGDHLAPGYAGNYWSSTPSHYANYVPSSAYVLVYDAYSDWSYISTAVTYDALQVRCLKW